MQINSSVHFGQGVGKAFWLGSLEQIAYGDGKNLLHNFTRRVDVIGCEMMVSTCSQHVLPY